MSAQLKAGDFTPCLMCGKGVMHTGIPLFYRVKLERFGVLANEVRRVAAMEQFMGGNVGIARAFHDPELTQTMMPEVSGLVCETCSMKPWPVAMLAETANERKENKE